MARSAEDAATLQRLDEGFDAASADGVPTVKSIAEAAGVSVETIRRYLKEFPEDYMVKNGVVLEKPPLDDSTAKTNRG